MINSESRTHPEIIDSPSPSVEWTNISRRDALFQIPSLYTIYYEMCLPVACFRHFTLVDYANVVYELVTCPKGESEKMRAKLSQPPISKPLEEKNKSTRSGEEKISIMDRQQALQTQIRIG